MNSQYNFNNSLDPITWVFDLLRASSNEDLDLNDFGIEILPQFSELSLLELTGSNQSRNASIIRGSLL